MADEIRVSARLQFSKGGSSDAFDVSATVDMAGAQYAKKTQTVGTSEENLDKGDISTIGYVLIKNLDATNFVQVGASTGVYSGKISPGETYGPVRWVGSNVIAKSDTGACIVEYLMVEA